LCLREQEQLFEPGPDRATRYDEPEWWNLQVEAASTFCEAGQWAMLTQPESALALWRRAGQLFRQVDFGFGYYLLVTASTHEPESDGGLVSAVWDVARASYLVEGRLRDTDEVPEPLLHPQQQAYVMLAGATMAQRYPDLERLLSTLAERSPHSTGVTPVGALGIPISILWTVASALIRRDAPSLAIVAQAVAVLARRYEASISSAMVNQYLWRNAASPVDVGSFDIVALTMNAYSAFDPVLGSGAFRDRLQPLANEMPLLARSQMEIAMEMAEAEGTGLDQP
jgi:hypothetical protein